MPNPEPYLEISEVSYAPFAAEHFKVEELTPGTLVLRGPCPRCRAVMETPIVDSIVRSTRSVRLWRRSTELAEVDSRDEPMMCDCEESHPNRPDGLTGCGAYWILKISVEAQ